MRVARSRVRVARSRVGDELAMGWVVQGCGFRGFMIVGFVDFWEWLWVGERLGSSF